MNRVFGITFLSRRTMLRAMPLLVGFAVLSLFAVNTIGAQSRDRSDHFWSRVYFRGVQAEHYDSLADMTKASDAVVLGRITLIQPSRSWIADPELGDDGIAFYAKATIHVDDVVAGHVQASGPGAVSLEIFLTNWKAFSQFAASVPPERALFFLRRKPDTSLPYYMLVTVEQGYVRDFGYALPPVGSEDPWLSKLSEMRFDDVVAAARSASLLHP